MIENTTILLFALFFYLLDAGDERDDKELSDGGEGRRTLTHPPLAASVSRDFIPCPG
jgi:hypothetical protein